MFNGGTVQRDPYRYVRFLFRFEAQGAQEWIGLHRRPKRSVYLKRKINDEFGQGRSKDEKSHFNKTQ
jgi:hypothetical protein